MKKLLGIVVLGLLLCNIAIADDSFNFFKSGKKRGNTFYADDGITYRIDNQKIYGSDGSLYWKKNNGILIIAGKGHEDIQIYKNKNYIFNDRLISYDYAKNL